MRALVVGWFSFDGMGATAGDLLAKDVVCEWLEGAGVPFEVATAPPFSFGLDWRDADPDTYSHLIFVCGPFGDGEPITSLLERFAGCRLVGVDLSLLQSLDEWDPFDLLIERDSSRTAHPDLAFLARPARVPLLGIVLIHHQPEYGDRDLHETANGALLALAAGRTAAAVRIDTRLDEANESGLRTPEAIASVISRMDAVLTTRLHGMVLALAAGVPAVVVDPVQGGAKVLRQALTVDWPLVFTADAVDGDELERALDICLSPEGRTMADRSRRAARRRLDEASAVFRRYLEQTRDATARPEPVAR